MPSLRIPAGVRNRFRRDDSPRDAAAQRRWETRRGLFGALAVVIALVAVAVLYAVPFGKHTYTAELTEAQSVRAGDAVRLAGISVGKVESLELRPDRVLMTFTVDSAVFLGRETSLDIRMLTVVGGHYVALFPAGTTALGSERIPSDRVRLPYSLAEAFQDAAAPIRGVDGATLRGNLDALAGALTTAPDGLRQMLDGVEQFVDVLTQQRSDVSKAISISDEYLRGLVTARGELKRLVDKVNVLETVLGDKRTEVRLAVETLNRVVGRLAGVQPAWEGTLKPMAERIAAVVPELDRLGAQLEPLLGAAQALAGQLRALTTAEPGVTVDRSEVVLDAQAAIDPAAFGEFCVPVRGRDCR